MTMNRLKNVMSDLFYAHQSRTIIKVWNASGESVSVVRTEENRKLIMEHPNRTEVPEIPKEKKRKFISVPVFKHRKLC